MWFQSVPPRSMRWQLTPPHGRRSLLLEDLWRFVDYPPEPRRSAFVPKIDVTETREALCFTAELPGLARADCEVSVKGDVLVIRGEKKIAPPAESARITWSERARGSFVRTYRLPFQAEPESVSAVLRDGVLTVTVRKPVPSPPRAVRISNA